MFGNESEAAIVKVMRMREQLRPYVMAQYEAASIDGTPIMRPLFFDFHTDAASQTVDDQQMYKDFDIILDHFSRVSQLDPTPHALWAVFYLVPSLTSC